MCGMAIALPLRTSQRRAWRAVEGMSSRQLFSCSEVDVSDQTILHIVDYKFSFEDPHLSFCGQRQRTGQCSSGTPRRVTDRDVDGTPLDEIPVSSLLSGESPLRLSFAHYLFLFGRILHRSSACRVSLSNQHKHKKQR